MSPHNPLQRFGQAVASQRASNSTSPTVVALADDGDRSDEGLTGLPHSSPAPRKVLDYAPSLNKVELHHPAPVKLTRIPPILNQYIAAEKLYSMHYYHDNAALGFARLTPGDNRVGSDTVTLNDRMLQNGTHSWDQRSLFPSVWDSGSSSEADVVFNQHVYNEPVSADNRIPTEAFIRPTWPFPLESHPSRSSQSSPKRSGPLFKKREAILNQYRFRSGEGIPSAADIKSSPSGLLSSSQNDQNSISEGILRSDRRLTPAQLTSAVSEPVITPTHNAPPVNSWPPASNPNPWIRTDYPSSITPRANSVATTSTDPHPVVYPSRIVLGTSNTSVHDTPDIFQEKLMKHAGGDGLPPLPRLNFDSLIPHLGSKRRFILTNPQRFRPDERRVDSAERLVPGFATENTTQDATKEPFVQAPIFNPPAAVSGFPPMNQQHPNIIDTATQVLPLETELNNNTVQTRRTSFQPMWISSSAERQVKAFPRDQSSTPSYTKASFNPARIHRPNLASASQHIAQNSDTPEMPEEPRPASSSLADARVLNRRPSSTIFNQVSTNVGNNEHSGANLSSRRPHGESEKRNNGFHIPVSDFYSIPMHERHLPPVPHTPIRPPQHAPPFFSAARRPPIDRSDELIPEQSNLYAADTAMGDGEMISDVYDQDMITSTDNRQDLLDRYAYDEDSNFSMLDSRSFSHSTLLGAGDQQVEGDDDPNNDMSESGSKISGSGLFMDLAKCSENEDECQAEIDSEHVSRCDSRISSISSSSHDSIESWSNADVLAYLKGELDVKKAK